MTDGRGLLPLVCSAGLHSALAVWLVAASGAGALRPLVVDLVAPEPAAAPFAEPARPPAPASGPQRAAARAAPPAARSVPAAPRAAPSPAATAAGLPPVAEPSPAATPPPRAPAPAVETARAPDAVGPTPPTPEPVQPPPADADGAPGAPRPSAAGGEAARPGSSRGAASAPGGPATALARPGIGSSDGRGAAPAEYAGYLKRFREAVQSELKYPLSARRRGLAGSVELEVVIAPDGRVTAVKVVSSSSHEMLDEAATDAVRRLRPIPLPPNLPARPLVVRLPLVFDLR